MKTLLLPLLVVFSMSAQLLCIADEEAVVAINNSESTEAVQNNDSSAAAAPAAAPILPQGTGTPIGAKLKHPTQLEPNLLRGLWIVVGVRDLSLLQAIKEKTQGNALIRGLTPDAATTAKLRAQLAQAGLNPLVTVETLHDPTHLPYVDHIASIVVVDESVDLKVPDLELQRILFYNRPLISGKGTSWVSKTWPMPDDVGEWTHGVINPQRSPISTEARLGPWVNGMRWMVGDVDVTKRSDKKGRLNGIYASGNNLSPLGIRLVDGVTLAMSKLGQRKGNFLRAFDAANGLPLWSRAMEFLPEEQGGSGFFIASDIFIATKEGVFGYFTQGGPLIRLDLHTGKELQRYEQGIHFKVEKPKRSFVSVDTPSLTVNVFDGRILQSYQEKLVLLDIESGTVLWTFSEKDSHLLSPCLGDDGRIYAALTQSSFKRPKGFHETTPPPKAIVCINPKDGSVVWRTPIDAQFIEGISGPKGGYLPIVGNFNAIGGNKPQWNNGTMMIETETGRILWTVKGGGGARGYTYMRDGEVVVTGALSSIRFLNPATGKIKRGFDYGANSGGCGFETFTQNFLVRGQMMHPVGNLEKTYASAGFRPSCQIPVFTGYSNMYSTMTRCGCGFFLPFTFAAASSHRAQPPVSDDRRREQLPFPILAGAQPGPSFPETQLTELWPATKDSVDTGKSTRFSDVDPDVMKTISEKIGRGGSQGDSAKSFWYGRHVEDIVVGDVTITIDAHRHAISGKRGDEVVWTTVVGGRVGSKPVAIGDAVYAACHDGYVYKLSPKNGAVQWRVLIAPNYQKMMAFGQLESVWPCMGVLEHEGKLYTTAGRSSTLDQGIYAAEIDPKTGALNWHIRMSAESMEFADEATMIGNIGGGRTSAAGWGVKRGAWPGQPFSRARMSINAPPMLTGNKLHVNGAIYVDVTKPEDVLYFNNNGQVIGGQ